MRAHGGKLPAGWKAGPKWWRIKQSERSMAREALAVEPGEEETAGRLMNRWPGHDSAVSG